MSTEMSLETDESSDGFVWETFLTDLATYVSLELTGQAAEEIYPTLAFHIDTSPECQDAYYRELQRQTLEQAHAEEMAFQPADKPAQFLRQLLVSYFQRPDLLPEPTWYERVIEHGSAWLEQTTAKWRQVRLSLSAFQMEMTPAPAATGMMSDDTIRSNLGGNLLHIAPEDATFEITVSVSSDSTSDERSQCQIEVLVTLFDRFGDYSGVKVTLLGQETTQQATTDSLGRVSFLGLPNHQVEAMQVIVSLS